ncbi:spermidine/putrescine-binding periplasmic protein [Gottschalkia purinilytica]|uniref:Spermidine/putrescine-binding periplasmic protein n=1 Tax=Gottschalkia purinilytica TaxID=1503 RepID=A0A0L0WC84_GOTPU|nr:ABC transporter substrate-binding protein [Gottschalkia purinilytica]KNF09076.1 spermidine/putrescine-binding periplasmic protein [Gottschalkia purinilytica]
MKKLGKKIGSIILASLVLTLGLSGCQTKDKQTVNNEERKTLTISTFGSFEDMYRKNIFDPFEKKHNVKIVLELGNNSERIKKLRTDTDKVDIAFFTDYYAMQAIEDGLFEKMNRENIPNINKLYDIAKEPLGKDYGPAYAISSYGLIYNPDKIEEPITSWGDLWKPELKGKIALSDITVAGGPFILMAAAEQAGVDIKKDEDKAFEKVKELTENGLKFHEKTSEAMNMFSLGDIALMDSYSYEVEFTKENVPNAKWVNPKEGSYALLETVNIVKGTKNKELAEEFINWLLSEDVQKAQAVDKVESPVNKDVKLTEEQAKDIVYGKEIIKNLKSVDLKYVNKSMDRWIERWNKEINNTTNN